MLAGSVSIIGAALVCYLISAYFRSPLKGIPGPFLAKFTNVWRLWDHCNATQIDTQRVLHEKLGPAVRIGPNVVSLNDPSLISTVYSTRGNYLKSDFYAVNDAVQDGHIIENVFGTRSNAYHAKYMRPIQKLYSVASILSMEHLIDRTIESLCEQLEARFVDGRDAGKTCDIAEWIGYSAWDVVGQITFSEDFGFLKSGSDVQDMALTAETVMHYFGIVGQMPVLDKLLGKNTYCPIKFPTFANAAGFSFQKLMGRLSAPDIDKATAHKDFLSGFLKAKDEFPDVVGNNEVVGYLLLNMLAGADTTAIVEKATIYHVLRNPAVLVKLQAELDAANLSFPASYAETRDLPYLNAVIKEALRIHPPVGHIIERVVPAAGLRLPDGRLIAAGTIVGMNPWVLKRNKIVYGHDADTFRPERWLRGSEESLDEFEDRFRVMRESDLTFGAGNRACTGRNMAQIELCKMTATLFGRYDMAFEDSAKDWTVRLWWFVFIDDIRIKITRRHTSGSRKV